jgi:hypothetical protein
LKYLFDHPVFERQIFEDGFNHDVALLELFVNVEILVIRLRPERSGKLNDAY